jgi:hypothetical protein
MSELLSYIENNKKNFLAKWENYLECYEKHLNRYKNTDFVLLEIGVNHGGSLQMWRNYFGNRCKIYGIDIDPNCKKMELDDGSFQILIGDQSDRNFLKEVKNKIPKIDVVIDDGGHFMSHQINSYEELFHHVSDEGIYIIEDLHTSYWSEFGGGYKNPNSFIEYSKNFIDYLHSYRIRESCDDEMISFSKSVKSIHYYESILVIEKQKNEIPKCIGSGYQDDKFFSFYSHN